MTKIKEKDLSYKKIRCSECFKISIRKDYIKIQKNWLNGVKCPKCWGTF